MLSEFSACFRTPSRVSSPVSKLPEPVFSPLGESKRNCALGPLLTGFLFALTVISPAKSQIDTTLKEFYPLHLHDVWQYRDQNNTLYTYEVGIQDTSLPNGHHYAAVGVPPNFTTGYDFDRVDSLLRAETFGGPASDSCGGAPYEYSIYHLAEPVGSVWNICQDIVTTLCHPWFMRFEGISTATIFGQTRQVMRFTPGAYCAETMDTAWYFVDWSLVRGVGVYREETIEGTYRYLTGAVINGVQYGTIVGIHDLPSTIPNSFILKQNYPNPFNPVTTIEYELPEAANVTLKVYDALGREVATLVEDRQSAGRYHRILDASSLSSGVYFYTLIAGEYFKTRNLVIIR
jgi:type IX secretion system substrate protein